MSNYQWLEQLPSNWTTYSLGHVARVSTGTADVQDAEPDGHFPFYVRSPHILRLDRYTNDTEAVITAGDGNVGDIFHIARGRFAAHQRVYVIEPGSRLEIRFLAYVMAATFKASLSGNTAKSTVESLRRPMLTGFRMPGPPLSAQRVIADYLDRETSEIDTLITELSSAQDLARERHSAALERLIVNDGPIPSELRRHNPHRKSGTSVNGAPWPAEAGEPGVLKTGAASQREYRPHENKAVIDPVEQARLSTPVEADRVLVNRANTPSNVGAAAYVERSNDNLFLSDKLWSIDFQGVNEYFAFAMQTRLYQDQASQRAVGTSLSMQNLPYDEFLSIRLPAPSVERQLSICATLREEQRSISASVSDLDRAITIAKERRAALITAAVTGRIDVTAKRRPAAEQLEDDIKELS
ncbi:restriction endonuclease subunit S [Brachybacterium sp. GU-2]|uniref:restriction endonuclease subunit S n=1 Tax=Brachybacterium sp. GU-2 TaxID=3069708 RepID=UPI00280B8622|nr:restriction endonuclease subunit S [Brachybacterium sp. GU-2]WME22612.1 restriction endonuclease subunit S [Brachybacterium sp. GU-2]